MSLLAIYLNDHLAAATAARELARRAAASNRSSSYGPFLERLSRDIEDDRRELLAIIRALGLEVDRLKVLGGWSAEKLGRVKLNGRLLGYSPLSRVVELEVLELGVAGKLALWRALERRATDEPALAGFDLAGKIERAQRQLDEVEAQRLTATEEAFGQDS